MAIVLDAPSTATVSTDFRIAAANGFSGAPSETGIPGRIEIATAPDGSSALKMRVTSADTQTYGGYRSELLAYQETTGIRWYAFDLWIPSSFPASPRFSFCQIHDSPDGGETPVKFPNFEFVINNQTIEVYVPENVPSELTANSRLIGACPAVFDAWIRCGMYVNWQSGASGWLEAIYNGEPVAKEWWRASRYTDAVGPYLQIGVYDLFHTGFTGERIAYYKNIQIGDSAETYATMFGALPTPGGVNVVYPR